MSVSRLENVTPIGVEQMGDLADSMADPDLLRLENLDTNIPPPDVAIATTRAAAGDDDANSYLPFLGMSDLRRAAAQRIAADCGQPVDWKTQCIISAGGLSGILNVLLATLEPGDEVLLTDPTYVGLLNRVRLAGGVPRLVPLLPTAEGWRLDLDALANLDVSGIRLVLMMSPSMPTGAVLQGNEWQALADVCERANAWLLNDAAMERILFDGRTVLHPGGMPELKDRVITVGAASKEYRMIGWRVGWVVGPPSIIADVARVSISNVVCQTGIAMRAVAEAITTDNDGIAASAAELEQRRDLLLTELVDYAPVPPHGGWSMLIDTTPLGMTAAQASAQLLKHGQVAATPMTNWGGTDTTNYLRLVFSNESVERLADIRSRFARAFER